MNSRRPWTALRKPRPAAERSGLRLWLGYGFALAAAATATGLGFLIHPWLPIANISVAYLLGVMVVAMTSGLRAGILASLLSFLAFNFFFTEPRYTFAIADTHNILTVVFFLIAAVVGSNMAARLQAARLATERERLRAALLSSLSHDLRTPLASIMGAAGTLLSYDQSLDPTARRDLAQTVLDEAERLNRFVQNLLDMTRLGSGALEPRVDWVDLHDVVAAAVRRAERLARRHQIKVEMDPSMPLLCLDAVLMEQVIFNLLDNACKYAPPGTPIRVWALRTPQHISIEVTDQGPGIPPQDRDKVFDMFYRVGAADTQVAGTGLGLAICQGIVQAHGGSIRAEPGLDGGTCIIIHLPPPPAIDLGEQP